MTRFAGVLLVAAGACTTSDTPPGLECGPGTILDGNTCVVPDAGLPPGPAPRYQIRAPIQIGADDETRVEVLVIATQPDGSPELADVVVNTDRPGAGTFTFPALSLGQLGATTYFVPCDQTLPGCLGPLTLTVALASAPRSTSSSSGSERVWTSRIF